MFERQWFRPGSQVALEEDALTFESLLRKREYIKATELANGKINSPNPQMSYHFWTRQLHRAFKLQTRSRENSDISVMFSGFWPGFNSGDNEILNLLRHASSIIGLNIKLTNSDPDLFIFSCFGAENLNQFRQATRLLYLGENVRPDYSTTDYSLTFDISSYCGRNIYLPLWLLRSTKYAAQVVDYHPYKLCELEQPREASGSNDAVVYIGNNSTPLRIDAINELSRLGMKVACYGSQTRPVEDKIATMEKYLYSLCFENSFAPGYVTEKIIDSFMGNSYPIYWGGAPPHVFNLDDYYVCNPFQSIGDNMRDFVSWRRARAGNVMPPLVRSGATEKIDSAIIYSLAKILFDLF
jgi:hypothetical protein